MAVADLIVDEVMYILLVLWLLLLRGVGKEGGSCCIDGGAEVAQAVMQLLLRR